MRLSRQRLHLQRAQLDKRLAGTGLRPASKLRAGWIRATRESVGMTAAHLARRMGVTEATVRGLERSEARGAISLHSLERAARALGCELTYALVPSAGSLEQLVEDRAQQLARRRVGRVAHSMTLEGQGSPESAEARVRELAAELKVRLPSELWEGD